VPVVEPRRVIGGNGRRRQPPLFATHLWSLEGKQRLAWWIWRPLLLSLALFSPPMRLNKRGGS
jgi:hypothetical protein